MSYNLFLFILLQLFFFSFISNLKEYNTQLQPDGSISIDSVLIQVSCSDDDDSKTILISWPYQVIYSGSRS